MANPAGGFERAAKFFAGVKRADLADDVADLIQDLLREGRFDEAIDTYSRMAGVRGGLTAPGGGGAPPPRPPRSAVAADPLDPPGPSVTVTQTGRHQYNAPTDADGDAVRRLTDKGPMEHPDAAALRRMLKYMPEVIALGGGGALAYGLSRKREEAPEVQVAPRRSDNPNVMSPAMIEAMRRARSGRAYPR